MSLGHSLEGAPRAGRPERAIASALLLASALLVSGCGSPPCGPESLYLTLTIELSPALGHGEVVTSGACSPPICIDEWSPGVCHLWQADMAAVAGAACTITLTLPDDTVLAQTARVSTDPQCDDLPVVSGVEFRDEGG